VKVPPLVTTVPEEPTTVVRRSWLVPVPEEYREDAFRTPEVAVNPVPSTDIIPLTTIELEAVVVTASEGVEDVPDPLWNAPMETTF
jgi:hypothetical protein